MKASTRRRAGPARALGFALLVLVLVLPGALRANATPQAPRLAKQAVRDSLASLLPTGVKKTDTQIGSAIVHLDRSLATGLWADDSHLGAGGAAVFDEEQKAVEELARVKPPLTAVGSLVAIDRQLAEIAIGEASGGDPGELARANEELGKGDSQLAKGHPGPAVDQYGKAWEHAQKAAAHPAGSQTFTLGTCNTSELIAAINQANATTAADTINLKAGCTYTLTEPIPEGWQDGLPMVVNPLTIHGNGATVERDPLAPPLRLLNVQGFATGGAFAVDHVNFRGGEATAGGAIFVHPQFSPEGPLAGAPPVTVTDSTFTGNKTVWTPSFDPLGSGGAIAVEGGPPGLSSATVTLERDTFTGNSTYGGPSTGRFSYDLRAGGAVFINGVAAAQIRDCVFSSNRTGAGADEATDAEGVIDAQPGGNGGAVVVMRWSPDPLAVTVTDSVFEDNATGPGGNGGPAGNGASGGSGGALFVSGPSVSLTLEGNAFARNSTGSGGYGVSQNGFAGNGGALSFTGTTLAVGPSTLHASTFTDNATGPGTDSVATLAANGSDGGRGGAIFVQTQSPNPATYTVSDTTFTGNEAGAGGDSSPTAGNGGNGGSGGAIGFDLHNNSTFTIVRDTFSGNSAGAGGQGAAQGGLGGDGGAVDAHGQGTLSVTTGTFASNSAGDGGSSPSLGGGGGKGGGIHADLPAGVTAVTFTGNHAGTAGSNWPGGGGRGTGGGISAWTTLTVADSTFTGNSALEGGGVWIAPPGPQVSTITGSTFSANTATSSGGAISSLFGTLNLVNSTLEGNQAGSGGPGAPGGAIFNYQGFVNVTNSTVSGNSASAGGGLAAGGPITLRNTIVAGNSGAFGAQNCVVFPGGGILDGGGNLRWPASDPSCVGTYGDPMLSTLASNGGPTQTMALGVGSAAIDAGVDAIAAAPVGAPGYGAGGVDQRGVTRPQGAHADIGAYER